MENEAEVQSANVLTYNHCSNNRPFRGRGYQQNNNRYHYQNRQQNRENFQNRNNWNNFNNGNRFNNYRRGNPRYQNNNPQRANQRPQLYRPNVYYMTPENQLAPQQEPVGGEPMAQAAYRPQHQETQQVQ